MSDTTRHIIAVAALLASATAVLAQTDLPAVDAPITASRIAGGGAWQTDGLAARAAQRWDLQLTRGAAGALTGPVTLHGSPLLTTGTVHARLVGRTVSGYIADANGNRALTFQGSVETDRMHGTYTDRTGETGAWAWDGPPPQ